jgi:ATP phosphoribosyltransferase
LGSATLYFKDEPIGCRECDVVFCPECILRYLPESRVDVPVVGSDTEREELFAAKVQELREMGFGPESRLRQALAVTGDVDRAIEWLLREDGA